MSDVWSAICKFEGEEFRTISGIAFTYSVNDQTVQVDDRAPWNLTRRNFEEAWAQMPVGGPGSFENTQGPAYTWAILSDDRVKRAIAGG